MQKTFDFDSDINTFLDKLDYWRSINLYVTLRQAESDISFEDARIEAVQNYHDPEKLRYMLSEAINSPKPKHRFNASNRRK